MNSHFRRNPEEDLDNPGIQVNTVFQIDADRETTAHGTLLLHRAETKATKVFHARSGPGTTAACDDTDRDGVSGLVILAGHFVANDGEVLDLSVTPTSGEINEPGEYLGFSIVTSADRTVVAESRIRIFYPWVTAQNAARR